MLVPVSVSVSVLVLGLVIEVVLELGEFVVFRFRTLYEIYVT